MKRILRHISLLLALGYNASLCQEKADVDYPFLTQIVSNCRVQQIGNNKMLYYHYKLKNPSSNHGNISDFLIDISRAHNSILYDTVGLRFDSEYEAKSFRENYPPRIDAVVPVGFPLLPRFWTATLANRPIAWFGTNRNEPKPGETVDSLVIMSLGIPAVRQFEVHPMFDVYRFFPSLEDTARTMSISQMDSIREGVNFHGWTVGPTAPPEEFSPFVWLDTLLSYVHQSHELGWINNTRDDDAEGDEKAEDGIVKNLDKRLMQTRDLIVRDKIGAAKGRLQIFLNKVERLWDRQQKEEKRNKKSPKIIFTSEAYALLKYNGEYLLDHLTEPKKERKEDRKGKEK